MSVSAILRFFRTFVQWHKQEHLLRFTHNWRTTITTMVITTAGPLGATTRLTQPVQQQFSLLLNLYWPIIVACSVLTQILHFKMSSVFWRHWNIHSLVSLLAPKPLILETWHWPSTFLHCKVKGKKVLQESEAITISTEPFSILHIQGKFSNVTEFTGHNQGSFWPEEDYLFSINKILSSQVSRFFCLQIMQLALCT